MNPDFAYRGFIVTWLLLTGSERKRRSNFSTVNTAQGKGHNKLSFQQLMSHCKAHEERQIPYFLKGQSNPRTREPGYEVTEILWGGA